ncbi:MAG: hypothetical protein Q8P67_24850, partial [archaeon]|nr:hypothetical protein [archaeon]
MVSFDLDFGEQRWIDELAIEIIWGRTGFEESLTWSLSLLDHGSSSAPSPSVYTVLPALPACPAEGASLEHCGTCQAPLEESTYSAGMYRGGYSCDLCKASSQQSGQKRWKCPKCEYDVCFFCRSPSDLAEARALELALFESTPNSAAAAADPRLFRTSVIKIPLDLLASRANVVLTCSGPAPLFPPLQFSLSAHGLQATGDRGMELRGRRTSALGSPTTF